VTGERLMTSGLSRAVSIAISASVMTCGWACHGEPDHGRPQEAAAVSVEVAEARLQALPEVYEAMGTVEARVAATVAAKVMALVDEVRVRPGAIVESGDVLARLDDRDLRAEFARARSDYERYRALLDKQAVTPAEFDAVQSRYRVAEVALSYASVKAPFSGIVADKFVDAGDMAAPGKPLFLIEQRGSFRLVASVPERLREKVGLGTGLEVAIDSTGEVCPATVGEVVPAADPTSRSVTFKADLACEQPLQSGTFGRARLVTGQREGIAVPAEAIHHRGQLTFVYVVEGGRARLRLVKIGRAYDGQVEILAGVSAGDPVVGRSSPEIVDGQPVEPAGTATQGKP
jgi:RND family efflux transporter MFP subunit